MKYIFLPACLLLSACQTTEVNSKINRGKLIDSGVASYYHEPQKTASGERFNPNDHTAAHKTLPLGSKVLIVNRNNGSEAIVRINDRGPYVKGRVIDTSVKIANLLGFKNQGLARVEIYKISD